MSLFGALRTSVTGLAAQSNRIGSVADNIANVSTTGYKQSGDEFETLLGNYTSGGVVTHQTRSVAEQGTLKTTSSSTDLAINGAGFFLVADQNGAPFLTRAGAFVPDAKGNLVNAAGFKLLGYNLAKPGAVTANGAEGLTPVNISRQALVATPSTTGTLTVNLPSGATAIPAANLPSANTAGSQFTQKLSLVTYDNLGGKIRLDAYLTNTGANTWEASVFNSADAAPGGGFPYGAGPLTTQNLAFDPTTGGFAAASPTSLSVAIPNGATLSLDLSKTSQFAAPYQIIAASVNGNAPSSVDHIEIGTDGTLSSVYGDGSRISSYRIPLATVESPDNLTARDGNVFSESLTSGQLHIGSAELGGLGKVVSSSLENSTVDLASELTEMIEAQRSYSANSKVFQASSDLLEVLIQLRSN